MWDMARGCLNLGDNFVSCADFLDPSGRKVDLGFLVLQDGSTYKTIQAIVHRIEGEKRPYHLDH